jgi:hypothetical protein
MLSAKARTWPGRAVGEATLTVGIRTMSRADGSGPHLVSTTSQGAIWFKQMTFWRVERGSTRRHGKNHRGVLRPVSWRATSTPSCPPPLFVVRRADDKGRSRGANFWRASVFFLTRKGQAKTCQFRSWARKALIATFSCMSSQAMSSRDHRRDSHADHHIRPCCPALAHGDREFGPGPRRQELLRAG